MSYNAYAGEVAPTESKSTPVTTDEKAEEDRRKEAEEAKRLTELYLRSQSVFVRKGELIAEANTTYSRNRLQGFQQLPDGVALVNTTRRFVDTTLVGRYGILTDGLEFDVFAPLFVHAEVETDFGVAQTRQETNGIGDIGAALRYQVWYERGTRPSLIIDVSSKSPSGGTGLKGTGTWNAGGGLTLLKSIDPVILFGRVGYIYNFATPERDLGNIVEYQLGMGFSLNDRVSFTMTATGAIIQPSRFVGSGLVGDATGTLVAMPITVSTRQLELMNLVFTTTVLVTKHFFIEPFVSIALTSESFTSIGVRVPYRF